MNTTTLRSRFLASTLALSLLLPASASVAGPVVVKSWFADENGDGLVEAVHIQFDAPLAHAPSRVDIAIRGRAHHTSRGYMDLPDSWIDAKDRSHLRVDFDPYDAGTGFSKDCTTVGPDDRNGFHYADARISLDSASFHIEDSAAANVYKAGFLSTDPGATGLRIHVETSEKVVTAGDVAMAFNVRVSGKDGAKRQVRVVKAVQVGEMDFVLDMDPAETLTSFNYAEVAFKPGANVPDVYGNRPKYTVYELAMLYFPLAVAPASRAGSKAAHPGMGRSRGLFWRFDGYRLDGSRR